MDDGGVPVVGENNSSGDFCLVSDNAIHAVAASVRQAWVDANTGLQVYRVSSTQTSGVAGASNCGVIKHTGQSARTFRIAGIQVESVAIVTSYSKTGAVSVSRAADSPTVPIANIPGLSLATGYTIVADFRLPSVVSGQGRTFISLDDCTTNNRVTLNTGAGTFNQFIVVGGSNVFTAADNAWTTTRTRLAISVSDSAIYTAYNGTAGTSAGAVSLPTVDTLRFGINSSAAAAMRGFLFSGGVIPQPLSQAQINAWTGAVV
jgi:hypothetical protein